MAHRIKAYIHARTGEEFSAERYVNHGYGGTYRGMIDLPKDGYPYRVVMAGKAHATPDGAVPDAAHRRSSEVTIAGRAPRS